MKSIKFLAFLGFLGFLVVSTANASLPLRDRLPCSVEHGGVKACINLGEYQCNDKYIDNYTPLPCLGEDVVKLVNEHIADHVDAYNKAKGAK